LLVCLCGWDRKYDHLYRKIQIRLIDLTIILNWDESKVSRVVNSLIKKGLIERIDRGKYLVKVLAEKGTEDEDNEQIAKIQEQLANKQKVVANKQSNLASPQEKRTYLDNPSLVSFKSNNYLRSDEEYLSIWREFGYPKDFDVSDMKFIDKAIYEKTGIRPN
jgi:hypothetical protein